MMKKRVLSLLATFALLCLLSACFPEPETEPEPEEEPRNDKVLNKYYTFRLADAGEYDDDTIGIFYSKNAEPRALSFEYAQASHEIFEVVFYYTGANDGTNRTVARAVWEAGEVPELRGVYRGANYGNIGPATAVNTGYAVLFAGTKDDNTLLAIGRLVEVDGRGPASTPPVALPNITTDTVSVTFEVTALKAGVRYDTTDGVSSFTTNYASNGGDNYTNVGRVLDNIYIHWVDKKRFPLFRLNPPDTATVPHAVRGQTLGRYTFNVDSGSTAFGLYAAGIVLAGGWNCEVRNPRYPITKELYQYSSIFKQDLRDYRNVANYNLAEMTNNNPAVNYIDNAYSNLQYFTNPVNFTFRTRVQIPGSNPAAYTESEDGSIFALAFETFVYNLTPRPTSPASLVLGVNDGPIKWRISPGVGTKWLDLDDGIYGEGGAILLGTGNIASWLTPWGGVLSTPPPTP